MMDYDHWYKTRSHTRGRLHFFAKNLERTDTCLKVGNRDKSNFINVLPCGFQEENLSEIRIENQGRYKKENDKKQKKGNLFKDFSANTSLHGIKYTADDERSLTERIWWAVMVISSFCICVYLVAQVWQKRVNNPIIVTFDEKLTSISKVPFPAVTFCSVNQANTTVFNYSKICETNQFESSDERELFNLYSVICEQQCKINGTEPEEVLDASATLKALKKVLLPGKEILMECLYHGERCGFLMDELITSKGKCFSINFLMGEEISDYIYTDYVNGWTYDDGYDDLDIDPYPKFATPSSSPAMELTLRNRHIYKDYRCSGTHEGFLIAIHPPYLVPRKSDFMQASYGNIVKFNVKPKVMYTDESIKDYPPNRRQCYFSHERQLQFYRNYTREFCEYECISGHLLMNCGCTPLGMPRNDSMPICSSGSIKCVAEILHRISVDGLIDDPWNSVYYDDHSCKCLQSCTSLSYEVTRLTHKMDMSAYIRVQEEDPDFKKKFNLKTGDTLTKIEVYMTDSHFIKSKRSEMYGVTDFLANCGGLIGVCLGFSILSLVEIIYFFTIRVLFDLKKKRDRVASRN